MEMGRVKRLCLRVTIAFVTLSLVLLLLAVLAGLAGLWGPLNWHGGDYSRDESTFDAKDLAMVQARTGITLPPGSRGLKLMYDGSHVDPYFIAKIEIPPSSEDAVIKQIESIPDQAGSVSGSLTEKVEWWNPSPSTTTITRLSNPGGNFLRVYLCKENGRWILYLEWGLV